MFKFLRKFIANPIYTYKRLVLYRKALRRRKERKNGILKALNTILEELMNNLYDKKRGIVAYVPYLDKIFRRVYITYNGYPMPRDIDEWKEEYDWYIVRPEKSIRVNNKSVSPMPDHMISNILRLRLISMYPKVEGR